MSKFLAIGGYNRREGEQKRVKSINQVFAAEGVSPAGTNHRIQDHRNVRIVDQQRVYDLNRSDAAYQADLESLYGHIFQYRSSLCYEQCWLYGMGRDGVAGILHRQGRDQGKAMAS